MTTKDEIHGIVGLLRSIADVAEHSSLTGSLRGGAKLNARYFNTALKRLQSLEVVGQDIFVPLNEESGMDEVGVASAHLAAYVKRHLMGLQERDTGTVDEVVRGFDESMRNLFGFRRGTSDKPTEKQEE